jgi:acetylglutamate kinase
MTRVIKIGGTLLDDPERTAALCMEVVRSTAQGPTVLVHGGGRRVSEFARRCGLSPRFAEGLRVTDDATLEIVLMVLAGWVNKSLVAALSAAGARAVGVAGGDGALAVAERLGQANGVDLGHVGRVDVVRPELLLRLLEADFLPVVAPLALSASGGWLNVNADQMAAAVARALHASALVFLTDVGGVLDAGGTVVPCLETRAARRMIESGDVRGGMRPKLEACGEALDGGVPEVLILPGTDAGLLAAGGMPVGRGTRLTL